MKIFPVFILTYISMMSCTLPKKGEPKPEPTVTPTPTATATPTPKKTLPPTIAPFPMPTADATEFEIVEVPSSVTVGVPFTLIIKAKELSSVNVFVDSFQVGKMFWDPTAKQKYLRVVVTMPGARNLRFKVDGEFVHERTIEVKSEQN